MNLESTIVLCDKNKIFLHGDAMPKCFRTATHEVTLKIAGKGSQTVPCCEACLALFQPRRITSKNTITIKKMDSTTEAGES